MSRLAKATRVSRRSFLTTIGVGVGTAIGSPMGTARGASVSTTLRSGMGQETRVYRNDSGKPGPTVLLVGGVHGNEAAGYLAGDRLTQWTPERGATVVVPRANAVAVEQETREANGDLNRQFPIGRRPETRLARSIWQLIDRAQPDMVVDLHESSGRYIDGKLGQSVAYPPFNGVRSALDRFLDWPNQMIHSTDNQFRCRPLPAPDEEPFGVLVQRTAYERSIPSFLVETYDELPLAERIRYHETIARGLVRTAGQHHSTPLQNTPANDLPAETVSDGTPPERVDDSPYDTCRLTRLREQLF